MMTKKNYGLMFKRIWKMHAKIMMEKIRKMLSPLLRF